MSFSRIKLGMVLTVTVVTAVALVLFLIRSRNISSGVAGSTDIILTNVQSISKNSSIDAFNFFTGTNIAQAKLSSGGSIKNTVSLLSETAYEEPENVSYDSNLNQLLLSTRYSGESEFINLGEIKPSKNFVLQKGSSSPRLLKPEKSRTVIDAEQDGGTVYGLLYGDNNKYTLFSTNTETGASKLLLDLDANQIVGITKTHAVLRNQEGKTLLYNKQSRELSEIKTRDLVFADSVSDSVLEMALTKASGGESSIKATFPNGKSKEYKVDFAATFVSKGFVISLNNSYNPTEIVVTNITSGEAKKLSVSQTNDRLRDTVDDVTVLKASPLTLAMKTSDNQVYLTSEDLELVKSFEAYSYPRIRTGVFNNVDILSEPVSNEAFLTTTKSFFSQSLLTLKSACSCDVNQVNKVWLSRELAATPNEDYTGDGSPPEER